MEWIISIGISIIIVVIGFSFFLWLINNQIVKVRIDGNDKKLIELEERIMQQQRQLDIQNEVLKTERGHWNEERSKLLIDIAEALRKIHKLEVENRQLKERIADIEKIERISSLPQTPLLLICGDKEFCEKDAIQLNRAKIWYRMLEGATKQSIAEEFSRRRQNKDLYPWVHISAHGNEQGILLSDGISDSEWWNSIFDGVKVAFFANCSSVRVGDNLAGLVDYVIVFYGKRESELIEQFTYTFWSEMIKTGDAMQAYKTCLGEIPGLRRFADIRTR